MAQDLAMEVVGRLDDDEVRERVCAGDLSDFDDVDLDDEQRTALAQLAENFPEVAGFSILTFNTLLGGKELLPLTGHSPAMQVTEVKVRAYDPENKKEIVGRS